ncbi:hypothetical protein GDO78_022805, partial [Eleutherodactylus coqui]
RCCRSLSAVPGHDGGCLQRTVCSTLRRPLDSLPARTHPRASLWLTRSCRLCIARQLAAAVDSTSSEGDGTHMAADWDPEVEADGPVASHV